MVQDNAFREDTSCSNREYSEDRRWVPAVLPFFLSFLGSCTESWDRV